MKIVDIEKYKNYRKAQSENTRNQNLFNDLIVPALLLGGIGAITWAIRGTGGSGGFDGALIHGMIWGVLWYYIAYLRGLDGRIVSFWLGFGVAIGGMWGYGQYVSWIQGNFNVGLEGEVISISPWLGFQWFFICGAAWLGIGGIFLGWALGEKEGDLNIKKWLVRIFVPILFSAVGYLFTILVPSLFFPLYSPTFYTDASCPECLDTISTNTTNIMAIMWWIGALVVALIEKDKTTLVCGLILGIGFGFGFGTAGLLCWGYTFAPGYIDWWKMWEIADGLVAGILYAIVLYWVQKNIDKKYSIEGELINENAIKNQAPPKRAPNKQELINNLAIILTVATLLLITYYGQSYRIGVFFELYDTSVGSYDFPIERIVLFAPMAIGILTLMIIKIIQHVKLSKAPDYRAFEVKYIQGKVLNLLLFLNFIGIISIWHESSPSANKIATFYTIYIWITLFGFYLLNRYYQRFN